MKHFSIYRTQMFFLGKISKKDIEKQMEQIWDKIFQKNDNPVLFIPSNIKKRVDTFPTFLFCVVPKS